MSKYRTVSLAELTPSSELATPVFDERHVKLLDSGTIISRHLIDRLKSFGITEVMVKSSADCVVRRPSNRFARALAAEPEDSPEATVPVDRCSRCGAVIAIRPPAPDSPATVWHCKTCGAVYFGGDEEGIQCLGVSKVAPEVQNPFARASNAPSIPPENVQRLVKSLASGEYSGDDRRRHKRYPVSVPVVAVALASDFRIKDEPVKMTTANVSLGGAALIHTRFVDAPYLALDFTAAGVELMQVVLKVLRVKSIGSVYEMAGEFISQLSQRS